MNKSILIVLAIAVAVYAKPINRKWEEISGLVHSIRGDVSSAIIDVVLTAEEVNVEVAKQIYEYLEGKAPETNAIFDKIHLEIESETLTYYQAVTYFTELETLLNKVKDDLRNFVSQLPQEAQIKIKNILDNSTDAIREKKEKILTLLN